MRAAPIIEHFERHPSDALSIHQLANRIGRSYGWTHQHCQSLAREGVLVLTRIGPSLLCTLSPGSELAIAALCYASGVRSHAFSRDQPTHAATAREIITHLPHAIIAHTASGFMALSHDLHGKHVINGHEINILQPTREHLETALKGTILHGYESFWRQWARHTAKEK